MFEISQLIRRVIDMLQEAIFENYGIVMGRQEATGTYLRFFSNNTLYTIIHKKSYQDYWLDYQKITEEQKL